MHKEYQQKRWSFINKGSLLSYIIQRIIHDFIKYANIQASESIQLSSTVTGYYSDKVLWGTMPLQAVCKSSLWQLPRYWTDLKPRISWRRPKSNEWPSLL